MKSGSKINKGAYTWNAQEQLDRQENISLQMK